MITRFTGPHRFLSNFYPARVRAAGIEFESVEHAYQAHKALHPAGMDWLLRIAHAYSPGEARRIGRQVPLPQGWEDHRLAIMERLVYQKFKDPGLRAMLLATGDQVLAEGNRWGDTFWGVCNGQGRNELGRILMKVRRSAELSNRAQAALEEEGLADKEGRGL